MLWYTASSVKNAANSAVLAFVDQAAQNLRTSSSGLSIWFSLRLSRSGRLSSNDAECPAWCCHP
jgi:hypothetical protein